MFSKQAAAKKIGETEGFKWRGKEISRIEGLSDAVFALAVTLLIVSTEVPKTYDDLVLKLRDFVPFAACFVQLMSVWYSHYLFHRRYDLQDFKSIVLTMTLLFVVLFYTYPLKFVFVAWWFSMVGGVKEMFTSPDQLAQLFTIYAGGFIVVYLVFGLMYIHAYQSRITLKLDELEIWDTKHSIREMFMMCGVGVISLILANLLPTELIGLAGVAYGLLGLTGAIHGSWSGKRRKKIYARLHPAEPVTG